MTASRTRLVYSARGSIPSTWERNVLQQSQAARYSPTVSSMKRIFTEGDVADGSGVGVLAPPAGCRTGGTGRSSGHNSAG